MNQANLIISKLYPRVWTLGVLTGANLRFKNYLSGYPTIDKTHAAS
jgi:hypothetical protein